MEKDKAIQNQKVFVSLESVLHLQGMLRRKETLARETWESKNPQGSEESLRRGEYYGAAQAIKLLGLPISCPAL